MTVEVPEIQRDFARWQKGVAGVLAKSTRKAVEDLPADPERLLDSPTYDGIAIRPLYTALDELPEPSLPGQWPFVRGGDPRRDVNSGWKVAEVFGGGADPALVNETILDALGQGASAIVLAGLPPEAVARALQGVYLDLAPVQLEAGAELAAVAEALLTTLDAYEGDAAAVVADLGADPLGNAFADRAGISIDETVALARRATARAEQVRAITVDGTVAHESGASDSQELAVAVAAGVAYLRLLQRAGLTVAEALEQISFRIAATDDQFLSIAKFRAARVLWARVAEVAGAPDAGGAVIHAVTSEPMMAQRDPWVNMLRTTLAAFGAGVGGADSVRVRRFDDAIPGGLSAVSPAFAARIARNTQLLLIEESHVARVLDPGGGSWFIEYLTESLAQQAWSLFTEIEAAGGFEAATELIRERIAATRAQRADDIAHRRTSVTGVNEFPNLAEEPLPPHPGTGYRYAADFEELRDRSDAFLASSGARPSALLLPLGPLAEHNVRTTFASNLLASGGIEAINPGVLDASAVAGAVADAGARIAVICGTDARYAAEASAVVDAAKAAGITDVYLAGPERAVAEVAEASRPDGYLTMKINAVEALSAMLTTLGA
ncbi:methylmalonyl-CoA mutase small subunit [Mycobacteroides abscessus]|uniref:methylmalonyl-CoA mutase small subunit n=1 Tax=Mycobacteroides abscessus TaxID=36809 RepID=UPI0005DB0B2C|nr:methylmalonyl-CoA mutase small subunit [Mycobacteroides abscessus]AMU56081.1 methylmalonyl-CoA mutase [Mycobacteroides abscessus]MBE5436110.1 methylmalonyl-CoA mutase, small subunit [Mycobacteroides abscessus]MBE5484257.1 methylmalonyl-CoA mutase, small subunit [Mycobacteroides abscessus]MBN7445205.1 methylmalonyl-CoA mutase small subunit [Mycobacteroides abscessus subsp. abscessus]MBN7449959.1 methylmalonyl-CoA mutase small subunit [Mycobacteroides abscessus subsp. abscessus]